MIGDLVAWCGTWNRPESTGDRVTKQRSSGGHIARERAAAGRELKSFITVMSKRKVR